MAKPSKFQKEFWQAVWNLANGKPIAEGIDKTNIVLDAKAGGGKTFSITYAMKYIPVTQRVIALMFNKRNAEDIQTKLPKTGNCEGLTTHSLGARALRKAGGGKLSEEKMRNIFKEMQMTFAERQLLPQIRKLVSIAKANGIVPKGTQGAWGLLPDEPATWAGFIDHHAIDFDEPWQEETAIAHARTALRLSIDNGHREIDFDDMLFLPVVMKMPFPKYDWVFVDECQDLAPIQREMCRRALGQDGHLVAVGDENQAIYGFRSADSDSVKKIVQEFNAHVMPLSICYRCDKNIVREAKKVVPAIEYWDSRDEGTVSYAIEGSTREEKLAKFTAESVILCPYNAPLVETALALIRNKVACHMVGRDFAQGIVKLLEKLQAVTAQEAEKKLDEYEREEYARLMDKEQENKAQLLEDKCATLRAFLSEAPPNETVERIIASIQSLFNEAATGMLTLSSIHRSKGGEWPRVFLMESGVLDAKTVKRNGKVKELLPWEIQQKRNLLYVAITRAQNELIFVAQDDVKDLLR